MSMQTCAVPSAVWANRNTQCLSVFARLLWWLFYDTFSNCGSGIFASCTLLRPHQGNPYLDAKPACVWRRQADRRLTQHVWLAWHGAIKHHAHVKQAVATAIMRICHRSSANAFEHWQHYTVATRTLRVQEMHVLHLLQYKRLQQTWQQWHALVDQRQQRQVSEPCCSCTCERHAVMEYLAIHIRQASDNVAVIGQKLSVIQARPGLVVC